MSKRAKRSGKTRAQRAAAARRRAALREGAVWHQSAEEAALAVKPRYNGYACGHGAHGNAKYDRTREKREWKRQLRQEGALRGPFPVLEDAPPPNSGAAGTRAATEQPETPAKRPGHPAMVPHVSPAGFAASHRPRPCRPATHGHPSLKRTIPAALSCCGDRAGIAWLRSPNGPANRQRAASRSARPASRPECGPARSSRWTGRSQP